MNKELIDFLEGIKNAVILDGVVIGREKQSNADFITITVDKNVLYQFWNSDKKKTEQPKHTGGKKSYTKLYTDKLYELREKGISADITGYMVWLSPYVQWDTGLIVKGRKKQPLKFEDMMIVFALSRNSTSQKLNEMERLSLITHDKNGYRLAPDFISKGGKNK